VGGDPRSVGEVGVERRIVADEAPDDAALDGVERPTTGRLRHADVVCESGQRTVPRGVVVAPFDGGPEQSRLAVGEQAPARRPAG
jgi:hypothetical protein